MGSRRAARPSRNHARPRGGLWTRGTALVLGAVTVTAGVGITLAVAGDEDGSAADRVATSAADEAPGAEDAAGGAAPLASASASPSATASSSPSGSAKPKEKPKKTASPAGAPSKAAEPASKAPVRTTEKSGGDRSAGGGDTGSGSTGAGADSGPDSGSGGGGGPEAQVLALVNEERASAGCSPVTANDRLTRAADDYSDVMADSGVMSHTGPDGSTMTTRVEAAGYQWSTLGENIARGQADAASVMDSWMNSPGHRANILNCSFKELGVGVHFGDGGPWWTQNFGASR
ncbi:CAP domain-containing protein [Streptomyces sp. b94]|uniref:CAP domain-containing protein n=1 Tax=Streptomyces sp. b94 TaxID=1827634 RepID=UPI001B382944|nr:CAP domain-containing protein [Streptomyces sp. b94]MBQ1095282.1 CAP domain-containing protein [Streptomyces sp. b94]